MVMFALLICSYYSIQSLHKIFFKLFKKHYIYSTISLFFFFLTDQYLPPQLFIKMEDEARQAKETF